MQMEQTFGAGEGCNTWNLELAGIAETNPHQAMKQLQGGMEAAGGWVLSQGMVSTQCSEMDFEFPRGCSLDVYVALLGLGVELTAESHTQMAALWQCTQQIDGQAREELARLHLCLFAREGSEAFLGCNRLMPRPIAA